MRVVITTTPKSNYSGYRISIVVDGQPRPDLIATPGQVITMRNACIEEWTRVADSVEANGIPVLGGGMIVGESAAQAQHPRTRGLKML